MPRPRRRFRATTVADFASLFERGGPLHQSPFQWYRGESRSRPKGSLLPSIARRAARSTDEWSIYQRFRQSAAAFLPFGTMTPWDWLLYMQHFGAPTRLLDWTESALAGLYFAVEQPRRDRYDGVVWCLDPLRLNERAGYERVLHCAGIDDDLDNYTIEAVKRAPATTEFKPVALIAQRSFPRLIAQQGTFTVIHRQRVALDSIRDGQLLRRITVPAGAKERIRQGLRSLGITRLVMFPEIQSLGRND